MHDIDRLADDIALCATRIGIGLAAGAEQLPAPPRLRGDAMTTIERQQQRAGIHINRTTSLPGWDGTPADVGAAVEALAQRS